jgi:hypothetical protein
MANTVEFQFSIGQDVTIAALKLKGRIFARCDRGLWLEYRVIYWADSKRCDEWLCEHELTN